MDAHKHYLMSCPSMERQDFCSLCGRTGKIDAHHVVHRSQGGGDGPVVMLCHECHMAHHGEKPLVFNYDCLDHAWFVTDSIPYGSVTYLITADPNRDPASPATVGERLGSLGDELRELVTTGGTVDYYIGVRLADALSRVERSDLAEWVSDEFGIKAQSASSWITKRATYGKLPDTPEVRSLGITKGYLVARMVGEGADMDALLTDLATMPRDQFDAKWGKVRAKRVRTCPHCGGEL